MRRLRPAVLAASLAGLALGTGDAPSPAQGHGGHHHGPSLVLGQTTPAASTVSPLSASVPGAIGFNVVRRTGPVAPAPPVPIPFLPRGGAGHGSTPPAAGGGNAGNPVGNGQEQPPFGLGVVGGGGGFGGFTPWGSFNGFSGIGGGFFTPIPPIVPFSNVGGPVAAPMPFVAQPFAWNDNGGVSPPKAPRSSPAKTKELVTIGDRLMKAGNLKRAEERYLQAARATEADASPRVRLAQVAIARGKYADAAARFREALKLDPQAVLRTPSVAPLFGEPKDFDKVIAKLESHVLQEPGDRDAWFALGAEQYLVGQTKRAGDIFVRLSDKGSDTALSVLLDATSGTPLQ